MRQIIYIHGGEAFETHEEYMAWLRDFVIDDPTVETPKRWGRRLAEDLGPEFQVIAPSMPGKREATYEEWSIWFEKHIPYIKDGCIFVGNSLGANFLAKYLSEHELPVHVAAFHLVAGCFGAPQGFSLDNTPLKRLCKTIPSITIYHSSDDKVVSPKDAEKYVAALPCANFVLLENRGHFLQEEFPELLERLRK